MKTLFSSVVVLIASVSYVTWQALSGSITRFTSTSQAAPTSTTLVSTPTVVPAQSNRVVAPPTPAPAPIPTTIFPATAGNLHDGIWTGSVVQTNWGPIEIQITVAGGKINDVVALQYPTSRSRSLQISRYSLPIFEEQVISRQTANIDSVSGATQTARGFRQAVQTAMQRAG